MSSLKINKNFQHAHLVAGLVRELGSFKHNVWLKDEVFIKLTENNVYMVT